VKSFVLDCSATVGLQFGDEPHNYYVRVFEKLRDGDTAIVPPLWHYELRNSLLVARKKRKMTAELVADFAEALQSFSIKTIAVNWANYFNRIEEDVYLAFSQELTAYDASYLALAMSLKLPLATTDKALKKAALAAGIADAVAA
jgi:predicted nucleic acid-binding protein